MEGDIPRDRLEPGLLPFRLAARWESVLVDTARGRAAGRVWTRWQ
jgi:hypothetical protein